MKRKKIGFLRACVLYHGLLAIAWLLIRMLLDANELSVVAACKWYLILPLSGGFFLTYGLVKILYFELVYRPGRRLLAKEAQLKDKDIDFDHIREGEAS